MMLKTRYGIEFETFESGPDESDKAVLLLHDWWGVLDYNHEWAARLAELGYKTLVVDLYDGECAYSVEHAGELMRAVDQDDADSKLLTALDYLKGDGRKVVTLGWSFGGRQAMQAALLEPEIVQGAILIYCRMLNDAEALKELGGPVLAIYAEAEKTWPEKMERFAQAMAEAGKQVESLSFAAGHGFINPRSERYDQQAAAQSWEAVKDFIQRTLG